ncbi:RNA polymerase sigma-70 factor [Chitinophaga silvatica]|uniref:RNA polymerase sigma-70 factor n=1 Tax=Chitinophaga silvatica TaxID=2282649 RepID=UPI001314BB25|nr:RNA polymerase sigma-70 factor [Chitinophaga silvatica]
MWQLAKAGNDKAFELLYTSTATFLANQAFRVIKDREQAKDILQDVFISLYLKRETIPTDTNILGYLCNAIKYKTSNALRNEMVKGQHHQNLLLQAHQQEALQPQVYERSALRKEIDKSIHTLPQKCREVFMLNYYGNLGYKAIAKEMGISVKTVEKHMSKALQVLRRDLKEEHVAGLIVMSVMLQQTALV